MTTNLLLFCPEVPNRAIQASTSDSWGDAIRLNELNNNRLGPRHNLARLTSAKTGRTVISYDLGPNGAQTVDHVAISRADLLQADSVAALIVRGSSVSAFTPSSISGCVAWFDPNAGVTVDGSGGVSAWVDRVGGISASQGTAANRPILTRYDNVENVITYSETYTNAAWDKATYSVTASDNVTTDYSGASTAGKIVAAAGTARRGIRWGNSGARFLRVAAGQVYAISVDVKKSNYDYAWIGEYADSPWHGCAVNLATGAFIGSGGNVTSKTITSLGSGWYRVYFTFTAAATHFPEVAIWFGSASDTTSPPSGVTYAGTEEIYIARPQLQRVDTDLTYVKADAAPIFAGVNGGRTVFFDSRDDRLRCDDIATHLTGDDKPFTVMLFARHADTSTSQAYFALGNSGGTQNIHELYAATTYRSFRRGASGSSVSASGGTHNRSPNVLSFVFTGTTVSVWLNGSNIVNAAAHDVVSATFNTATIGAWTAATVSEFFGGDLGDLVIYNRALTTDERESVEAYLTTKYSSPIVGNFAFTPNAGEGLTDYVATFSTSSSYRHYWVEMESSASSRFTHSKLFLGAALDMGDPDNHKFKKTNDSNDDFEASSGAVDLAKGKASPYRISITWDGLADAKAVEYFQKLCSDFELRQGVFLYTATNHQILDGHKMLYMKLLSAVSPDWSKVDYTAIAAEFEELPL